CRTSFPTRRSSDLAHPRSIWASPAATSRTDNLHDEDAIPRLSGDVHDPVLLEESFEDFRLQDDVRRGMLLRAHGRPAFEDNRIVEPTDAFIVPQLDGQGRVRHVPDKPRAPGGGVSV